MKVVEVQCVTVNEAIKFGSKRKHDDVDGNDNQEGINIKKLKSSSKAKGSGRPMQDRIKEHDREIRLAHTQTSAVSEHDHNTGHQPLWNEVKFIDRDPHYYTHRVKEAIHIRLHSDDINRDSEIEIPEA